MTEIDGERPSALPEEPRPFGFRACVEMHDGMLVLVIEGEVDLDSERLFSAELEGAVHAAPSDVLVDLSRTTYLDSVGIRCLVAAAKQAEQLDKRVRVANPRPPVRKVLEITGLDILVVDAQDATPDATPPG